MYKQSEIVLVPFPYSDLSYTKKRPVLSKLELSFSPFQERRLDFGILPEKSFIKIHKLFTISKQKIIKKFSKIRPEKFGEVYNILVKLFKDERVP